MSAPNLASTAPDEGVVTAARAVRLPATVRGVPQDVTVHTVRRWDAVPTRDVRALAASTSTGVDAVLLAVFGAVVARYTGARRVVLGVPGGLADLDVTGTLTFDELVRATGAQVTGSPPAPAPDVPLAFYGTGCDTPPADAGHELSVQLCAGESLELRLRYRGDLFTPGTARRLIGHLDTLLRAGLADPATTLGALPLLTPAEVAQTLVTWNDTRTELPALAPTLHGGFSAQARLRPDAPAVVHEGGASTFGEIERSANRLAHHLRLRGVGRGDKVGLCLHRSPGLLVAALAVMKAGAAYVPLDPKYPPARLQTMLADARCAALISLDELADVLAAAGCEGPPPVVLLDRHAAAIAQHDDQAPPAGDAHPNDLCYVIYTSGSTGRPKGIELRHAGVLNNLLDLNTRFGVGAHDGVLALSSPSFDMSVYEFLGVTLAGGRVVVPDRARAQDPGHWLDLFARHRLTIWNTAPSLLDLAVTQAERAGGDLSRLRLVLAGGDWIPVSLPDRLRPLAPQVRFISLGGATESSIHSTVFEVTRTDPGWVSIPYGRPMANQRVYLLDEGRRPVPVGVPGELYLAGDGLARGYVGAPALTSARFGPWSFGPISGERLYRTGDLARYGEDGLLELLGRIDFQVKIHGVRIETGEVEAALRRHPAVHACAVTAHGDTEAGRQLVAYVVATGTAGARDLPDRLREHAVALLPGSMAPALYVLLDALPLSPNGKVDRAALPAPAPDRSAPQVVLDEPAGPAERLIADVWAQLLGVERIGRDDNFFVIGGDSFVAMRAVQQIDPHLPIAEFYAHPTVRDLAARLRALAS